MAAIVSTAFAVIFFVESTDEKIEVVKNYWQTLTLDGWERLPLEEEAVPYTLGVVIRKPVEEISIGFGVLRNRTLEVNYTGWDALSLREKAVRVGGLEYLDSRASDVSGSLGIEPYEEQTATVLGGKEFQLLIIDYYPCMAALAPAYASIEVPYLFAFYFDEEGNILQHYAGYWDFFEDRTTAILDLTIQLNENATRFADEQNMAPGFLPLDGSLPLLGEVLFEGLETDDRIFVTFTVNGGAVPGEEAFMQLIRMRLDGVYLDSLVNVLKR
jgi:hypothetical protein